MENLSNVDNRNEKPHPKPTDDPGAQIETVSLDSQNELHVQVNTKDESLTNSNAKENLTPKSQENNNESLHAKIETVTPDTENEYFLEPDEIVSGQETDLENDDTASENPGTNQVRP